MLPGPSRDNVNFGGKVIMPPSSLDKLTRLNIAYPMQFELINNRKNAKSHAGVLEFIAEEGRIYLPHWMMRSLKLEEGDLLQVLTTDIPQGSFVQLEWQSIEFLEISDPKAVLENTLRNFSILTVGDVFQFSYNETIYDMAVRQVKPESSSNAISVIETDLSVDFIAPEGYVEPKRNTKTGPSKIKGGLGAKIGYDALVENAQKPAKFATGGQRMSGKPVTDVPVTVSKPTNRIPAPLRLPKGTLFFGYEVRLPKTKDEKAPAPEKHFAGRGQSIKQSKKDADVIQID